MTIDELKKEKAQLERDLLAMIHDRVEAFWEKTGVTPSSISVRMIPKMTFGPVSPTREYLVAGVEANISL